MILAAAWLCTAWQAWDGEQGKSTQVGMEWALVLGCCYCWELSQSLGSCSQTSLLSNMSHIHMSVQEI